MKIKKKSKYIIDAHTHLGYWPTLNTSLNTLLTSMKNHNIDFSIVSFDGSEFKEPNRFNKLIPQLSASKKLLSIVKENKSLLPLIWIRPHTEKNSQELETFLEKHRDFFYGLKFHPYTSRLRISDPRLAPYLNIARKFNYPILVHTALDEYANINELATLAKNNHDINFIAAHLELGSNNKYALSKLKEVSNLYGDTAWVNMESLREAKKLNIINKIMFGSDSPIDGKDTLNHKFYKGYFSNKIGLRKDDYDKLMYKNALKIYSIDEKDLITRYQWDKSPR